jgi:chemotaxis signal transduction protein
MELDALFAQEGGLEVLMFSAAGANYAVPISQVLYIEQDTGKSTKIGDDTSTEVVDYMGRPVKVCDFSRYLGVNSSYENCQALIKELRAREADHLAWLQSLRMSINEGVPFEKARDPHQCAFGRWYDAFTTQDEQLAALLLEFDEPHKRIHSLADKLLNLAESSQDEAIQILDREEKTTLSKLRKQFAMVYERLEEMSRQVLMYVEVSDNQVVAVRLSEVSNILNYQRNQVCSLEEAGFEMAGTPEVVAAYLRANEELGGTGYLLDWRRFN